MKSFLRYSSHLFHNTRWFQRSAITITLAFSLLMVLVIFKAYSRKSGATGIDAVRMHQTRLQATEKLP